MSTRIRPNPNRIKATRASLGINAAEPQAGLPYSLIIKLSPLDTPSKLGRCLSPSASSFSICLLNLNKPLYISTKLKFMLSLF